MSYRIGEILDSSDATVKGLLELIDALMDIDEDSSDNSDNERTITDENGDKIILSYNPKASELTITKNDLKLTLCVKRETVKKRITRYVLKDES